MATGAQRSHGGSLLRLFLFGVSAATIGSTTAQVERQIEVPIAKKDRPVVVTEVTLAGTKVQAGRFIRPDIIDPVTPFQADDDWISELTVHLFNRTNKTIVFVNIVLGFPETGDGFARPQRVCNLNLGRIPRSAAFDEAGRVYPQSADWQAISFGPGETMEVRLSDHLAQISGAVASVIPLTAATKLVVRLGSCYFQDGLKWAAGGYLKPDSEIRGRWKALDRNYFPGDKEGLWPPTLKHK